MIPEGKMEREEYRPKEERSIPVEHHMNPENDLTVGNTEEIKKQAPKGKKL